jgi:histidinol-phosphate aminotransferase
MVSRRSFMRDLGVLGAAGVYFGESLVAANSAHARTVEKSATVWLDSNENPMGPPATAIDAMVQGAPASWRYHFDEFDDFSRAIARAERVSPPQVMFGVGSSEVIAAAICAFATTSKPMITASPTYDIIVALARSLGRPVIEVPLTAQWGYPVQELAASAQKAGGGMIYLCNPNNPTGSITANQDIEWLVNHLPPDTVLFVDEAYLEFARPELAESAIRYVRANKNVVIARTFSKIFGMAGVRAGYGCARPDLIAAMYPFMDNVIPYVALRAAMAALDEKPKLVPERRKVNARVRDELCQWLDQRKIRYIPTHTNFVMIDVKRDVREFGKEMLRQGVAVGRPFPPLDTMLRVTIGTDENMRRFREVFSKVYSA